MKLESKNELPHIGLTMGDPAGIGPELCLQAVADESITAICRPQIFGCPALLARVAKKLGLNLRGNFVVETGEVPEGVQPGTIDASTGQAAFDAVTAAITAAQSGEIQAVVTAPIHKEAWAMAGIKYPGHTELLAEKCQSERFCMMMISPKITCSLVTTHIGLSSVPGSISTPRILEVIELTAAAMQRIRQKRPKLAVLGLNPHAGEGGLFGNLEEEKIIVPAIEAAREKGLDVQGPFPPDTAFLPSYLEEFDAHICMYHDQGLIPFKTLAFDTGVNTTLGLDIVRTSVDHGTALDLAWQGVADASSLFAAIRLAASLATKAL